MKVIEKGDELKRYFNDKTKYDGPANGMLLTTDAHRLYDDFQWSVWVTVIHPGHIMTCLKLTVVLIGQRRIQGVSFRKVWSGTYSPFYKEHFKLALWTHVRAYGRDLEKA